MEKFEIGKVYSYERRSGIGYDECTYCDYYLITRKTEKSIWYKKISAAVEIFGSAINEKVDFNKFEKAVERRSKIGLDSENEEYFIDKRDSGCQDYIFLKYTEEVELN